MSSADKLYKTLLQAENPFQSLTEFVNQAEEFQAGKTSCDVVHDYLKLSVNCQEILQLVKNTSASNAQNVVVLFQTLTHILLRLAKDLSIFASTGQSIVNEILAHGMKTIFNFLNFKQKASRSKAALHLLSAMVALGKQAAHKVLAQLDFSNPIFISLINRCNVSEEENVRTAFLNLIVLIMRVCDQSSIIKLVELKGFLNAMMPGLISDHASTILLLLKTFQKQIVENPDISRTSKLHLFTDYTLKSVIELYTWKGPKKPKKGAKPKKRKLGEDADPIAYEVDEQEALAVQTMAHEFMLSVCCSHKLGIIFYDRTFGTSGQSWKHLLALIQFQKDVLKNIHRNFITKYMELNPAGRIKHYSSISLCNMNHVMTKILKLFPSPYSNSLMSEFVISALKACPDQLKFFLPTLKSSFRPRNSVAWLQTVNFLKSIINSQDPVSCLFRTQEKRSLSSLVLIAKTLCIPDIITASELEDIFQKGDPLLCYYICQFLTCILKQVENIIMFCEQANLSEVPYSIVDLSSFCQSFVVAVIQCFPFEKILKSYLTKLALLLKGTQVKSESDEKMEVVTEDTEDIDFTPSEHESEVLQIDETLEDQSVSTMQEDNNLESEKIPLPALSQQLSEFLEAVKLVKNMYVLSHQKFDSNLNELFSCLQQCRDTFSTEELFAIHMKVIDLFIAKGESTASLWTKNLAESPLVNLDIFLMSSKPSVKHSIAVLIHKLLVGTGIFDQCKWEADAWVSALKSAKAKHIPAIIGFINDAIYSLLQEPNKFIDDIVDTTLEKSASFEPVYDSSKHLEDLLMEENAEKENNSEHYTQQCFSSFVPAVLMQLKYISDLQKKGCKLFVETALCDIIHHQHLPSIFFAIINKYKPILNPSILKYWEMLSACRFDYKIDELMDLVGDSVCNLRIGEHLRKKFILSHSSETVCDCDTVNVPDDFDLSCARKTISQILMYISIDFTLITDQNSDMKVILDYFTFLKNLFDFMLDVLMNETTEIKNEANELVKDRFHIKFEIQGIVSEILCHPVINKLFLQAKCSPHSQRDVFKMSVNTCTDLVCQMTAKILNDSQFENCWKHLNLFKHKLLNSNLTFENNHVSKEELVVNTDIDLFIVIGSFSNILTAVDVTKLLENVLSKGLDAGNSSSSTVLTLLLKLYVEKGESVFLTTDCVNSLFSHYGTLPKKQKELCVEYIVKILEMHPSFSLLLKNDSCHYLMKNPSKELPVIGRLIDYNECFRQLLQNEILRNPSKFKNCAFLFFASKCMIKCNNSTSPLEEGDNFLEAVAPLFWEELTKFLQMEEKSPESLCQENVVQKAVMITFQKELLASKKLSKFFKMVEENLLDNSAPDSSTLSIYLSLLNALKITAQGKTKALTRILKISLHWLMNAVPKPQNLSDFSYTSLVDFIQDFLKDAENIEISEAVDVEKFFSKILKVAMKCNEIGGKFLRILTSVCKMDNGNKLSAHSIYKLVVGHSKFFDIMLSNKEECLKESVVDLLIDIIKLDGKVCDENHVGLFLASYGATMSKSDQKLLCMIKLLADNEIDLSKYRPFLWGKSAITHYSVMNAGNMYLWKQPKLQDVLSIFISSKIDYTILHYPLQLDMMPCVHNFDSTYDENVHPVKIYDLRFILPLFSNLLSPGSFVHIVSFVNSKVLMLIFISLSSFDPKTRAMGFYCLSQFYQHLEGARFREKGIWLCLLDSVRNSLTSSNPRIPSIVTLFLAKVAEIFTKPESNLYKPLYKFIMCKPALDIGQVPEFFTLFNSIDIEYRIQRMWLLNLLAEGLRSSLDFHVCEKRHIFSTVLSHYNSSLSTQQEKIALLGILQSAVLIGSSARILCQSNLISWLHGIIETINLPDLEILKSICLLIKKLWITVHNKCNFQKKTNSNNAAESDSPSSDKISMYISFPHEFLLMLLKILPKAKLFDAEYLLMYLSTLESVLVFVKNFKVHVTAYTSGLSFDHMVQIYDLGTILLEKLSKCSADISGEVLNTKQCLLLLQKIALHWVPLLNENIDEELYNLNASFIPKVLTLILHFNEGSYFPELGEWLYNCLQGDKKCAVSKLIFSSEGEKCFNLILRQFEMSMLYETDYCKKQEQLTLNGTEKIYNGWKSVLLYFQKVSSCSNLKTSCIFFNEICSVL